MNNPFSLKRKTVLITGASSGIGRVVAIECSQMGATVVLSGRNRDRLQETASNLEGKGHIVVTADLSVQEGVDYLVENCPLINGVVHCAGIPKICAIKHLKREILNEIINTNEVAPILLTAGLLKKKKIQRNSSVVFIASTTGVLTAGSIGDADYAATKGGLAGFSKTAAAELGSQNIRVNTICPGLVETPILSQANDMSSDDFVNQKLARYRIKRLGTPEDVAYGVIYLLSDASSWITGINLPIDGGCHL